MNLGNRVLPTTSLPETGCSLWRLYHIKEKAWHDVGNIKQGAHYDVFTISKRRHAMMWETSNRVLATTSLPYQREGMAWCGKHHFSGGYFFGVTQSRYTELYRSIDPDHSFVVYTHETWGKLPSGISKDKKCSFIMRQLHWFIVCGKKNHGQKKMLVLFSKSKELGAALYFTVGNSFKGSSKSS